jgi:hypothetical protein
MKGPIVSGRDPLAPEVHAEMLNGFFDFTASDYQTIIAVRVCRAGKALGNVGAHRLRGL